MKDPIIVDFICGSSGILPVPVDPAEIHHVTPYPVQKMALLFMRNGCTIPITAPSARRNGLID